MDQIGFKISARTAKLIGRENFSNPEGAIIELVKNSYDADAKECVVIYSILHERIPNQLSIQDFKRILKDNPEISSWYRKKGRHFDLLSSLPQEKLDLLKQIFFSKNAIYIIDNGSGMTNTIIQNHWMEIGTDNKEDDYISDDKRIKTGAKGIGRFALDRLGFISEMWTVPKDKAKTGSHWKMDWRQFDLKNVSLNDIKADIEKFDSSLKMQINSELKSKPTLLKKIEHIHFKNGTIIKITNVKDNWHKSNLEKVYKSLESLVPPRELAIPFKVYFYSKQYLKEYGEIETAFYNDFDYKVESKYYCKQLKVELKITRDELDIKIVKSKYSHLFKNERFPYDLSTLSAKTFTLEKSVFEILKWEKGITNISLLRNLGDIDFSFYYMKNTNPGNEGYPYRSYIASERQNVLKKFGGIKIYRDSFRIRPYGDPGNDWLKLGERGALSPAGAGQRIGDWRVGPNQIAGIVKISRITNANLIDKSDRGSLIENESLNLLKNLSTEIVNYFELDRSIILNRFYLENKEKELEQRKVEIHAEAEKLAERLIDERLKQEREKFGIQPDLFTNSKLIRERELYQELIEEGLQNIVKPEEADAEIAQVRTLASLGLIVSSFAHELKEVKNNADDIEDLESIYSEIVPSQKKKEQKYKDGLNIIDALKIDNQKVAHWVEYSMTAIKVDKRKRTSLKFDTFFYGLQKQWKKVLFDRDIVMEYKDNITLPYLFKAFEMDMSTIFSNLISNSVDSINNVDEIRQRKIFISSRLIKNNIEIIYSDTGTGLPKIFRKNKEQIFLPFTTSKKDKDGNDIGTGLGMYLVNNVINDNNGTINITDSSIGFKLKITFPVKNK